MPVSSPGGWASGLQESLEGVWPRRRALLWHHDAPCAAKGGEGATDAAGTGCVRAAARCPAGRSRARTSAHHPGSCAGARWAPPAGPPAAAGHSPLAGAGGKKTRPTLDRLFAARLAPLQASSIVVNLVTVSSESPLGVVPRSLVRSLHASAVDRPHQPMQRRVGVAVRGRTVATKGSPTLEKAATLSDPETRAKATRGPTSDQETQLHRAQSSPMPERAGTGREESQPHRGPPAREGCVGASASIGPQPNITASPDREAQTSSACLEQARRRRTCRAGERGIAARSGGVIYRRRAPSQGATDRPRARSRRVHQAWCAAARVRSRACCTPSAARLGPYRSKGVSRCYRPPVGAICTLGRPPPTWMLELELRGDKGK